MTTLNYFYVTLMGEALQSLAAAKFVARIDSTHWPHLFQRLQGMIALMADQGELLTPAEFPEEWLYDADIYSLYRLCEESACFGEVEDD
jgi:hypothetical protein